MANWTLKELDHLIGHSDGTISALAKELHAIHLRLQSEADESKESLLQTALDLSSLLEHETLQFSRAGEDYVNDQQFP